MNKYVLERKSPSNPFHAIFHPFDSFYDIRFKNKGKELFTFLILALWFLASIFQRQSTGYIFNRNKISELNIIFQLAVVTLPFLMWVTGNWVMSILMNGTGRFRDIWIVSGYSALPYILSIYVSTILSNVLAMNEPFAEYVLVFGALWSLILLLIGTMVIHEYGFTRNLLSLLLSVGVMFAILFLAMLFGSLWGELASFVKTLTREILFRL